jgi:hypothetical protein
MTLLPKERMKSAIKRLFDANQEYMVLIYGKNSDQSLGRPCTEEELKQIENNNHIRLPPSYRCFLLMFDGWKNFSGDAHLLSTADRSQKGIIDRIENFKAWEEEKGNESAADGFVIIAGETSTYIVYLDTHTQRPDDEMDVVEYGYEEGEMDRYPDLVSYLEDQYKVTRKLIAEEKGETLPWGKDNC